MSDQKCPAGGDHRYETLNEWERVSVRYCGQCGASTPVSRCGDPCTRCGGTGKVQRGRGRPSAGERIDIRIPADLLRRIGRDAKRDGVSRAELIRRILVGYYRP